MGSSGSRQTKRQPRLRFIVGDFILETGAVLQERVTWISVIGERMWALYSQATHLPDNASPIGKQMTNRFETAGEIRAIMDPQQVTDSFKKREFALEIDDGRYPQTVKFQLVQDKTALLDDFEVGQQVRVHFNLKGREYTRKSDGETDYWTNLECWRIEKAEDTEKETNQPPPVEDDSSTDEPFDDDIPF